MRGRSGGRIAIGLMLALAGVRVASADVTAGEAQAAVKGTLKDLLGPDRLVRDYAVFETERGEGALLVLFVTGAQEPEDVPLPELPDCQEIFTGLPLVGVYHVALVVRGALVNEVPIPGGADAGRIALPLKNRAKYNALFWGRPTGGDPHAEEPTRLVHLADYDGDGNAFEFRLVRSEGCETETLLAGYSPRQRKAVVFPFVEADAVSYWTRGLFEGLQGPGSPRLTSHLGCDHGDEIFSRTKFRFDARREAWVAIGSRTTPCAGTGR